MTAQPFKGRKTIQQVAAIRLAKLRGRAHRQKPLPFDEFVKQAWGLVEGLDLVWEPHMSVVCDHLVAVAKHECKRLIINIPPGTSKSMLTGVFFPAWVWTWAPEKKFIYASYSSTNSQRDALKFQEIVESEWYQTRWGDLTGKQWSATMMRNTQGGFRFATTVGGQVTGQHADYQFVDDPIKPKDATGVSSASGKILQMVFEWWTQTMTTRMISIEKTVRVIVMQRLADGDLAGEMLATGDYTHLCLPMEYDPERHCKTPWGEDWRSKKGEPLAPVRFPPEAFPKIKKELGGPNIVAAQWDQNPVPEGGGVFKSEWLHGRYRQIPKGARIVISWDMTFKDKRDSDYVACTVWAELKGFFYLIEVFNEQLDFNATLAMVRAYAAKYKGATILIEDKANGTAVMNVIKNGKRKIPGVIPVDPQGDKVARANAVSSFFDAGDVLHPYEEDAGEWWQAYFLQMTRFPRAKHDDIVDSVSQALMYLSGKLRGRFADAMDVA